METVKEDSLLGDSREGWVSRVEKGQKKTRRGHGGAGSSGPDRPPAGPSRMTGGGVPWRSSPLPSSYWGSDPIQEDPI